MNKRNTYVAIMAGGVGSRFWPGSREAKPKQFLDILGVGKSLIRLTFERFLELCPADHIFVVTHKKYREQVLEQIPELSDNQVLCEPSRNNTAPSVAYTAFKLNNLNPDANFVIAPSDHVILKEDDFIEKLESALNFSEKNDALLTLGIQPTRPDTGYGYINFEENGEKGIFKVKSFKEKPDIATAKTYLESGDFLWNAGIFIWKSKTILKAFEQHAQEIYSVLEKGNSYYNTEKEQEFIDEYYPQTSKISVDFAIMEKAENIFTLPADIGWSDLGTWASLHAELLSAEQDNVANTQMVRLVDTKDSLIRLPEGKMALIRGLHDYLVIDEGDVLVIYPKSKEQEIKEETQEIKKLFGEQFL
ncbi:MAG: mannose-1-phosphate guanylyltransferase [Bacteroidetes bacterium]|nr:MAG: mannose-1-phosphate guanylyltransferase [Bacteroidota bacterium]